MKRIKIKEIFVIIIISVCIGLMFNANNRHKIPYITSSKAALFSLKNIPLISINDAVKRWEDNKGVFLDARNTKEYNRGHIPGALNLPVKHFQTYYGRIRKKLSKDMEIVVYCSNINCNASRLLAEELMNLRYKNVVVMLEGWEGWKKIHASK